MMIATACAYSRGRLWFRLLPLLALLTGAVGGRAAVFAEIQSLIVLGDSFSDTGRTGTVATNPNPGLVWVDFLAGALGVPEPVGYHPTLSPAGTNFAHFGATAQASAGQPSDGARQLDELLNGVLGGGAIPADALVVVALGTFDLVTLRSDPTLAADAVGTLLTQLAAAGGRQFLVSELYPIGRMPLFLAEAELQNAATRDFNTRLRFHLEALRRAHPESLVLAFDAYTLVEAIVAQPFNFGLANVTDPASFDEAQPYLTWFWYDRLHPTSIGHATIGNFAAAGVRAALEGRRAQDVVLRPVRQGGSWQLNVSGPSLPLLVVEASTDGENWTAVRRAVPFNGSTTPLAIDPGASGALFFRAR